MANGTGLAKVRNENKSRVSDSRGRRLVKFF